VQVPAASVVVHSWVVTPLVPQADGEAHEVVEVGAASGDGEASDDGEASWAVVPESVVLPPPPLPPPLPWVPSTPLQPNRVSERASAAWASRGRWEKAAQGIAGDYAAGGRDLPVEVDLMLRSGQRDLSG
jgi:hypothetical protein